MHCTDIICECKRGENLIYFFSIISIIYIYAYPIDQSPIAYKVTDFSVVPFRLNFMLFSEKNHVKALKNQRVSPRAWSSERLAGATRRGQTMTPEGQRPAQCPDRVQPHSDMD